MAIRKMRKVSSWIEETKIENEQAEELLECRLIVLKIVRFMKDNRLSQRDLAEKLNVSPQYINKFLHGQCLDMKVSTILRYGKILGIKLLEVPSDKCRTASYNISVKLGDSLTTKNVFASSQSFKYPISMQPHRILVTSDSHSNRKLSC